MLEELPLDAHQTHVLPAAPAEKECAGATATQLTMMELASTAAIAAVQMEDIFAATVLAASEVVAAAEVVAAMAAAATVEVAVEAAAVAAPVAETAVEAVTAAAAAEVAVKERAAFVSSRMSTPEKFKDENP